MREIKRMGSTHAGYNVVHFESHSHMGTLLTGLNALRHKGLLLDITLVAGAQAFRAHRVVLASCSDYFRAMFTDAMRESTQSEICLNGVSSEGMRYLLEYAYTSKLLLSLANIQDVLSAASHVQIPAVVEACSSYLRDQLDLDNCVDVATISEVYSLQPLRKEVYRFMCRHLRTFSHTPEFQRLSPLQLEHLLECDFPVDCPEAEVLEIILKWIDHFPQERLKYAVQLFCNVHFHEIPSSHLTKLYETHVFQCLLSRKILKSPFKISSKTWNNDSSSNTLVNSRGMEMALLNIGGFGIAGVTNEITYYLPSLRKWRYLTSIPHVEQCNFGTAVLNNELFVVGGCFNQSLQENVHPFGFRYNPLTNSWSTMAPMQKERCRFSLTVIRGCLLAIGGSGETIAGEDFLEESAPCERYDPSSDLWTPIAPLPGPRAQHAGAAWCNYLYISGGLEHEVVVGSVIRYDMDCDRWEPCAPLSTPRADHAMLAYGDKLYVCGGWYEEEGSRILVDSIECCDLRANDGWHLVTRVPTPRYHAGMAVIGQCLFIVGGFHSATTFDRASGIVECYNFETGQWTAGDHYPRDIWEHTCCTLFVPKCRDDLEVIPDRNFL